MDDVKLEVGTWVRFMHGGLLVIGVIEYVRPARFGWQGCAEYVTSVGETCAAHVLEARTTSGAVKVVSK